ncbi:translocation/assembly module TamB domain-containing protein [Flavobacterium sp. K5-23]|uniref:translocation/assembly module TamB domain-containing protein n=1 Tax=Flavobacterium sp. K5-23 TaxID=2746225 RepID=UPI00200E048A|nr:translocation/assembly module TamB domain-containing protein [Flavobacterium sp. K5-23]UQD57272.1 translocation/assembly module TamB [Flavobacterium sp. K5-23]
MLILGIALSLPFVQTKVAQYFTKSINKDFGVNISIDEASVSVFGGVKFKKVLILDHHKDTLIYSEIINTNVLDAKKILDGDLIFRDIRLSGLLFSIKTYKNEDETNIDKFIKAFDSGKPSTGKHFLLKASKAYITNGHFILIDENREVPKDVDFTKLNVTLSDFMLYGPDINTNIKKMSFKDHRGIYVTNLSSKFSYTKKNIKLENLDLATKESKLKGDVYLNYKIEDFSNFNDKVKFDVKLEKATLSSNDLRHFYKEIGRNINFDIRTHITGTLNNLKFSNIRLVDSKKSQINGTINFKNLFGKKEQHFYMDGDFKKVSISYENLVKILPNVLGKKLPVELKKLGMVTIIGNSQVSKSTLDADFSLTSDLGNVQSVLSMKSIDFIDKASYVGNVVLESFDVGTLLNRKDLGKVSMNIDVDGKGFTEKYLNTALKGDISKIDYNDYSYNNIVVNGTFKMPHYKGQIAVNDPNLKMTFDGLLDLSKKDSSYDFHINVENADLHKLNFIKDTISRFKGDVIVQLSGNTIDNLQGNVYFTSTSYQNWKDTYNFNDFNINSSFDQDRVRTIKVNSPDIVEGEIVGKFQFNQLGDLMKNSLGSLYANFKPNKVNKGQFLKFNFNIYNKIVEVFYPEILIGSNTVVKGNIISDNLEFKLNFKSPQIVASKNTFDNIRIAIDNKNPLYNAYIELDSIKSKYYKLRDFSLINVTIKDTLFFRSEFKGGSKGEDYYNLNLYHTINKDNDNVVGISKSEMKFKDYLWFLNEEDTPNNQIVFDKSFKNFNFDDIILSHQNQAIKLNGKIKDNVNKDLKLSFKDVDLFKITPTDDKFVFKGNINGEVNFKQNDAIYKPTASLVIDQLNINNTDLGVFKFDIEGDQNFEKFTINSYIENENVESFNAKGNFKIVNKEAALDLSLKFEKFNLGVLSSLGGDVLSNIRGFVSGNATIGGNVKKPSINGRLYADNTGLTIPYLNVDYELSDRSIIDLVENKFLLRNNTLTDGKYKTKGSLNGVIEHNNFGDWKLDLAIKSKRLLALDTKDKEDAAYYGTAFIDGVATIKGPTNGLFIKVDAKSEKGTTIKIPINDSESVSDNNFIHFLTAKEKYNISKGIVESSSKYKGLELEFDLEITDDAEVEVILDRSTGHGMKGKGFGVLLFKINTLGKFNMWGNFQAFEGSYNFKYGGLIDKKFSIKKGGSIEWLGDPMKAVLNLQAVYKTIANPSVLLENPSFNRKVPVEVVIGIRGDLASPEPDFNIEFPTVSNVLKSEIQYKLNDKDVRQTQALYLLSSGGFLSPEGVSQSDLSGSLFETATGLIGDIIKSEGDKFQFGINFISADRRIGRETDGRFVATFSSKINERITFNGKVGVPLGGINESAVVGDFDFQYRVNDDGSLNLRLFNRENDINYIGQGIGYTQGFGVTYEVDFDTFKELVNKILKKNKLNRINNSLDQIEDSRLSPDFINFSKPKKPNTEAPKTNQEALIPEEY